MSYITSTFTALSHQPAISLRRAGDRDRSVIERLAALDSAPAPRGEVLLAEVGGEPWAALSLETGQAVADPFRRSGDLVSLLRARAEQERPSLRRGRPLLAPRFAA